MRCLGFWFVCVFVFVFVLFVVAPVFGAEYFASFRRFQAALISLSQNKEYAEVTGEPFVQAFGHSQTAVSELLEETVRVAEPGKAGVGGTVDYSLLVPVETLSHLHRSFLPLLVIWSLFCPVAWHVCFYQRKVFLWLYWAVLLPCFCFRGLDGVNGQLVCATDRGTVWTRNRPGQGERERKPALLPSTCIS